MHPRYLSLIHDHGQVTGRRLPRKGREEGILIRRLVWKLELKVGRSRRPLPTCEWVVTASQLNPRPGGKCIQSRETMDRVWSSFRTVSSSYGPSLNVLREAACRQHANEMNDAMNAFHNAAKSYKKSDPEGEPPPIASPNAISCRDRLTSDHQTAGASWKLSPSCGSRKGGENKPALPQLTRIQDSWGICTRRAGRGQG